MAPHEKRRLIVAIATIAVIAIGMGLAWRYTDLKDVVTLESTIEALEHVSTKWWAPVVLVLLYTPAALILFPRPLLTLAAVAVFGIAKGFGLAMAGVVVAATAFWLAGRRIPEKKLKRYTGRYIDKVSRMLRKEGWWAIAVIGLLPVAPFAAEMVIAGALRVRLWHVVVGVLIANAPGILGTTVLSDQIMAAIHHERQVSPALVGGAIVALVALFFFSHRAWRRMEAAI